MRNNKRRIRYKRKKIRNKRKRIRYNKKKIKKKKKGKTIVNKNFK